MKILALDTSSTAASVALLEDEFVLGEFFVNIALTHSQTLMPMVDSVLNNTKINIADIDLFCVNTGPGSFTGVRIGVSAIKGMAMAINKPCIGVSTLDSLVYNLENYNGIICAVMDARCNQVYNALFEVSNGLVKKLTQDRAILIDQLKNELKSYDDNIILVGDGAKLCYNSLSETIFNIQMAADNNRYQRASSVAKIAFKQYNCGNVLNANDILPNYLRMPQAERELKKKLNLKKE